MGEQGGALPNFGAPGSEQKLPSMEELLEAIENMNDLPEDSKQELRESILRGALGREAENLVDAAAEQAGAASAGGYTGYGGVGEITVLLILISVVFLILVFFGYKLYSSLMERERRREEKRKQKQQKKKK